MKKIFLFLMSLCLSLMMQAQLSRTVNITKAGTLSSLLTTDEMDSITNLSIIGTIDARDFQIMRDNMPILSVIDLSAANIVAYYGDKGTNNYTSNYFANTIPNYAFYLFTWNGFDGKTSLTSITLPTSVTAIGDNAFSNCRGLTSILIPASII